MSHQIIRPRVAELGGDVSVVVLRQAQEEVVVVFDDGHWTTSSAPGSRARPGVLTTIGRGHTSYLEGFVNSGSTKIVKFGTFSGKKKNVTIC